MPHPLRLVSIGAFIAAIIFFAIWSLNVLQDPSDLGWGLLCFTAGVLALELERTVIRTK